MDSDIIPATRRMKTLPFMVIWLTGHILSWAGVYFVWETVLLPDLAYVLFSGIILGGALGLTQKLLLRYKYGLPLHGWMRLTIVGWVLGWLGYFVGSEWIRNFYNFPLWLTIIPMFGIPALLQWGLLRRQIRQAWLWVVAAVVSTMTFSMVFNNSSYNLNAHVLSATAQGAVTGLTLLWLFGMSGFIPAQQQHRDVSRLTTDTCDSDGDDWYDDDDDQSGRFIQG